MLKMKNKITLLFAAFAAVVSSLAQPAGSLDPEFGLDGRVMLTILGASLHGRDIVILPDGSMVAAGYMSTPLGTHDFYVAKFLSDGDLDNAFGSNGFAIFDLQNGSDDKCHAIAADALGHLYLAGSTEGFDGMDAVVVKLLADGNPDIGFGTGGVAIWDVNIGLNDQVNTLTLEPITNKIIVGGHAQVSANVAKPFISKVLDTGELDVTFGVDGTKLLDLLSGDATRFLSVHDLQVSGTGKITFGGQRKNVTNTIAIEYWCGRLLNNGNPDLNFSSDGILTYGDSGGASWLNALVMNTDGSFTGVGTRSYFGENTFRLLPINENGTIPAVSTYHIFSGNVDIPYCAAKDVNGKIVCAGSTGGATTKFFALLRAQSNFAADATFDSDGKVTTSFPAGNISECFGLAVQTDNKLVAIGTSGNSLVMSRYLGDDQAELTGFELSSPADLEFEVAFPSTDLDWTDAFGVAGYEVEISIDPLFQTQVNTFNPMTSQQTVMGLLPETQYFWRVRAVAPGGEQGPFTEAWSFSTADLNGFALISPANNALNINFNQVTADWANQSGADGYEMQLATDASFTTDLQIFTPTASQQSLTGLMPATQYYWRVRATLGDLTGDYTSSSTFTTNSLENFVLVSPANNATGVAFASMLTDWTDLTGAVGYQVQLDISPGFDAAPIVLGPTQSQQTFSGLAPLTTYYWTVRATHNGSDYGAWQSARTFTTADTPPGINELGTGIISIYPNPTAHQLNIGGMAPGQSVIFSITNVMGQEVMTGRISGPMQVDVSSLASGVYFLSVGEEAVLRFVRGR